MGSMQIDYGVKMDTVYIRTAKTPRDQPPNPRNGQKYRTVAVAKDNMALSEKIVVVGLTGPDTGKWWLFGFAQFVIQFAEEKDASTESVNGGGVVPDQFQVDPEIDRQGDITEDGIE